MRKAILFEYRKIEYDKEKIGRGNIQYEKVEVGPVDFLEFSVDFTECENGVGTYASAIVELPGGQLENVAVGLIRFITDDITMQ